MLVQVFERSRHFVGFKIAPLTWEKQIHLSYAHVVCTRVNIQRNWVVLPNVKRLQSQNLYISQFSLAAGNGVSKNSLLAAQSGKYNKSDKYSAKLCPSLPSAQNALSHYTSRESMIDAGNIAISMRKLQSVAVVT